MSLKNNLLLQSDANQIASTALQTTKTLKPMSLNSLLARITQISGQCGGRPCVRGMRIRVTDILEMLAENVSISEILEDFPDLELADIQACLVFAARRTDFPRLTA